MVSRADVMQVLRTIDDPEMPINIVDLGIVADVRESNPIETASRQAHPPDSQSRPTIEIDITPTFVGCPALDVLQREIERRVSAQAACDVRVRFTHDPPWSVERISDAGREALRRHGVTVPARGKGACGTHASESPALVPLTRKPQTGVELHASMESVACPYCNSPNTRLESPFGPTRCRSIYYCDACRNLFEHMKPI